MSTNIAFLSGKGGSGKTTLALSIADLLSRCEIKTLLIDCDLSTNGATYFYESRLSNSDSGILSFDDLLKYNELFIVNSGLMPLEINPYLDFIPSVPRISGDVPKHGNNDWDRRPDSASSLDEILDGNIHYDVVLCDCQAGYTSVLHELLPKMDVDLFVLEADSISASAMRSLHLKIGNDLGRAKLYQVFNKATPEEFEIYSKITGTFFTNIGTLLFDWKIRQAFSRSQVPDLENTSAKFGFDLCEICKILLPYPNYNEKLKSFSIYWEINSLEESKKKMLSEAENKEKLNSDFWVTVFLIAMSSFLCFGSCLFLGNDMGIIQWEVFSDTFKGFIFLLLGALGISLILALFTLLIQRINIPKLKNDYTKEISDIDNRLNNLRNNPNQGYAVNKSLSNSKDKLRIKNNEGKK